MRGVRDIVAHSVLWGWLLLGLLANQSAFAAQHCELWNARVVSAQGVVEVRFANGVRWQPVRLNEVYCAGDRVRVLDNSRAALELSNETVIRLDHRTTLTLNGPAPAEDASWLDLLKGAIHVISRVPRALNIKTPYVNAAIEGTEFLVRAGDAQALIAVYEGQVVAENPHGRLLLASGQAAITAAGKPPLLRLDIDLEDAVRWTFYYPLVLHGTIANDVRRAQELLHVGRFDEAVLITDEILRAEPNNTDALALRVVMALAQNRSAEATALGDKAVQLSPQSATALLARSYALQARFDLDGARASVEQALQVQPDNALAWARLAELLQSLGRFKSASQAARKAAALDPEVALIQTVLGFSHLSEVRVEQARVAFEKAIVLDSASPLARLGLGLARIRDGDLVAGRRDLEIAAVLDPNNSMVRSYLGKAYFDERREQLASKSFALAKTLDPNDPTPWFYDAINKQTSNKPVDALHDLQTAIKLNGNRAIYRSKLLLDQDLAARSAGLARIYQNLGFDRLALTEGWKSVNVAPNNYSAHRFLADAYLGRSRHEIARVSELLQSQLLQPLNVTALQPQLAESNLLLLQGQGPPIPSFNEFNPLFVRNRLALQASGMTGNKNTWGDELTQSGLWNNISYSVGQFHAETDGFRDNNDQNTDLYNAFFQSQILPTLGVQAEYRYRKTTHGDLDMNWDLDSFNSQFERKLRTKTYRFGAHFAPAPDSDLIVSVVYQDEQEEQAFGFFDVEIDTDGYIAESQYLFAGQRFDLTAGVGYYDTNTDDLTDAGFFSFDSNFNTQHKSGYAYSSIELPYAVSLTLGGSYDALDDGVLEDIDQFNPKLGIMWEPVPNTLVRAAAFRVLDRSLITDQTIEPTQVAGFNQFFDDLAGTDAWRYGIALDQTFSQHLYGGIQFSRRDLDVPVASVNTITEDWQEDLFEFYLNWTPVSRVATSVSYEFEDFDADAPDTLVPSTRTHVLPVEVRYFHPNGFFTGAKVTHVKQDIDFAHDEKDDDRFTLVDAAVGYRLPKRYGILSVSVKNLFDEKFNYQGLGFRTLAEESARFLPERTVAVRLTLSF